VASINSFIVLLDCATNEDILNSLVYNLISLPLISLQSRVSRSIVVASSMKVDPVVSSAIAGATVFSGVVSLAKETNPSVAVLFSGQKTPFSSFPWCEGC